MNLESFKLRDAPRLWKQVILGYLLCLSLGYAVALVQVALAVGLTPGAISSHYHGVKVQAPQSLNGATIPPSTGETALDLDAPEDSAAVLSPERPQMSLKALVSLAHTHLFGMASFFFGLTALVLLTGLGPRPKFLLALAPWLAIFLDHASLFATRLWGAPMAYLTLAAGAFLGLAFVGQIGAILWELRQPRNFGHLSLGVMFLLGMATTAFTLPLPAAADNDLARTENPARTQSPAPLVKLKDFLKTNLAKLKTSQEAFALSAEDEKSLPKDPERANPSQWSVYYGKSSAGRIERVCTSSTVQGKEAPITLGLCYDREGLLTAIAFVEFDEDRGQAVRDESFLKQLRRSALVPLRVGEEVLPVTGATWTSNAMVLAVQRANWIFAQKVQKKFAADGSGAGNSSASDSGPGHSGKKK